MKLLHLEHVEDYVLTGQYVQAVDMLGTLADFLSRKKDSPHISVSTKFDGAPAIVFGVNPENGKFFVGTKSVFNKTPKICYSEEDVIRLYSDKPELCQKLTYLMDALRFEYLSDTIPKTGVYQGDLMWTHDSKVEDKRTVSFTPNTITYRINKNSYLGKEVLARVHGMVVHTAYIGDTIADMAATSHVDQSSFGGGGVVFLDPSVDLTQFGMTDLQYDAITDIVDLCDRTALLVKDRSIYTRHGKFMKMFMNHCVRMGEVSPDVSMYETFLANRNELALHGEIAKNRLEFSGIFMMHKHVAQGKKIMLRILNSFSEFFHEVDGNPVNGEGFVVTYHGHMTKLVDRMEFSRLNFANKRFAKA